MLSCLSPGPNAPIIQRNEHILTVQRRASNTVLSPRLRSSRAINVSLFVTVVPIVLNIELRRRGSLMSTAQMTRKNTQKSIAKPEVQSVFQQLMSIHWAMVICYLVLFTTGTIMFSLGEDRLPQMLLDFHNLTVS
jgi:hypothetical protein